MSCLVFDVSYLEVIKKKIAQLMIHYQEAQQQDNIHHIF